MQRKKLAWAVPVFVLATTLLGLLLARSTEQAPSDVPQTSSAADFSAQRAFSYLSALLAEGVPHPAGSEANRVIAQRIAAILTEQGYAPAIQEGFKCSAASSACAVVRNIVAVKQGREPGEAVLLTAHYDSVPAGPGAADDGAGVAALLEIAGILQRRAPLLHDSILLFSDGEEPGLFGAQLFAEAHPLMSKVGLVINLEGRGVSGPSLMFETSSNNAQLVRSYGRAVENPVSTSLLFEIYQRLPNDTDLSVYKRRGLRALNFAFARGAALYHSQRDDLAHLSMASLQHHGDNVLAVLLGSGDTALRGLDASGDATYFDVAGRWLVAWPAKANLFVGLLALAAIIGWAVAARGEIRLRAAGLASFAVLAALVLLGGLGWLLSFPLGVWPGVSSFDHPSPWGGRVALLGAMVLAALASARWLAVRAGFVPTLLMSWLLMAIAAVAMAVVIPGATYIFLAPVFAFVIGTLAGWALHRTQTSALVTGAFVGFVTAAYVALYHFLALEMVFSLRVAHLMVLPLVIMCWSLLPIATLWLAETQRRAGWAQWTLVAVTTLAAVMGYLAQGYTPDRPRGVNIVYEQDAANANALWRVESPGHPGSEFLAAAGFAQRQDVTLYGLRQGRAHAKPAAPLGMLAPALRVTSDTVVSGERRIVGELQSHRDNFVVAVGFAPGSPLLEMSVNGQLVLDRQAGGGIRSVSLYGIGRNPVSVELVVPAGASLPLVLVDVSALPQSDEGSAIAAARPANAAPRHWGDHAAVHSKVTL